MQNCELVTMISVLACTIAKDKTKEELGILAAIFTQLRRYLNNINCIRYRREKIIESSVICTKRFLLLII